MNEQTKGTLCVLILYLLVWLVTPAKHHQTRPGLESFGRTYLSPDRTQRHFSIPLAPDPTPRRLFRVRANSWSHFAF